MNVSKRVTALGLALACAACASISSPTRTGMRADDFEACDDYHRKCRDSCAPAAVEEVACYRNDMGGVTRVCRCEGGTVRETLEPSAAPKK